MKAKARKKSGDWGIFGGNTEKSAEKSYKQWERKTAVMKAKADYYEQQARKKKAKRAVTRKWPSVPTPEVKIKKKKQGKKLSGKRRIGII